MNLQAGNVLVNYDPPWNPMVVEQRIWRIQRLGTKHASVTVLNLVAAGSVEERIVSRLSTKLQAISQCLGDIESILETAILAGDDEKSGFEAIIRDLVIKSLQGVDVEEALRKAASSIEMGKRVFDEERDTVEKTLGAMDGMHSAGPKMPGKPGNAQLID